MALVRSSVENWLVSGEQSSEVSYGALNCGVLVGVPVLVLVIRVITN